METLAPAQDDSSGANPSIKSDDDSSPGPDDGRDSPPPNCAICLGTCRNKSFTDSCLHEFCFKCLLTWSKVKAECPLCKQNFRAIIHSIRSNQQYEEYLVEQTQEDIIAERIDLEALTTATRRFRYRTTLTLPRRESLAIQQLLLHYPLVAEALPPRAPPARRRRSPAAFRRTVYRHNLWARPLPDFTGRFRDCRPEFYRYNDTQTHRLVPWLNRELHYLLNENPGHISYVLARILEVLPQYHINSPEFREAMERYFGDRTEHFLHELYCFASTPYDMTGYDRNVQYTTDTRISTMVNEVISSSESEASVDSDIVMVSSSHAAPPPAPGPSGLRLPEPVYPQNYIAHPPANHVIPIETISHSDTDDDSSEVMVVGYIKPPQDRTPEVVDLLGSDSDVIVQDNEAPPPPRHAEAAAAAPEARAPLVKLSLKRHTARRARGSDSEDSYRPPSRRRRSNGSASTRDTYRTTPSPRSSPTMDPTTDTMSVNDTDTPSESSSDTTFSSSGSYRQGVRIRKLTKRSRKKKSKRTRSCRRASSPDREARQENRDRRSKKKSRSGKGVKSSRPKSETAAAPREPSVERGGTPPLPVPGPSTSHEPTTSRRHKDRRRRRRSGSSRESKKLRSVVNVLYNRNTSDDSSQSRQSLGHFFNHGMFGEDRSQDQPSVSSLDSAYSVNTSMARRVQGGESESEDDLPLNLTIQRSFTSL